MDFLMERHNPTSGNERLQLFAGSYIKTAPKHRSRLESRVLYSVDSSSVVGVQKS